MALPNLSHVALVPTGEFYALTHQEAHEANRKVGAWGGPIKADQGRDDPEATFRIRFKTPLESGGYKDAYYNAEELWKWAKATNSKVDPLGNPWFYEDWMALHAKYAQRDPVPHWVFSMRCSEEGHVCKRDRGYRVDGTPQYTPEGLKMVQSEEWPVQASVD